MRKLLTLDLSTTCTGWAVFNIETKKLLDYGFLKPSTKGLSKLEYPIRQLLTMKDLAGQITALIQRMDGTARELSMIVIEEVNRHKSRMSGKTLDGMHWILLDAIHPHFSSLVSYRDSDGEIGWRSRLNLRLSENDKKLNALNNKINKKLKAKEKLTIINKKHLAARYVNAKLGLNFDVDRDPTANDVVDALGIGLSELLTLQ